MIDPEARRQGRRWIRVAAAFAAVSLLLVLNAVLRPFDPLPEGAARIPTSAFGPRDLCTLEAATSPVHGTLHGDPTHTDWPVWLSRPAGHVAFVEWPHGWSVRFEPDFELLNERGRAVAWWGSEIVLTQVPLESAAGTTDDPYIARGIVLGGCYG